MSRPRETAGETSSARPEVMRLENIRRFIVYTYGQLGVAREDWRIITSALEMSSTKNGVAMDNFVKYIFMFKTSIKILTYSWLNHH